MYRFEELRRLEAIDKEKCYFKPDRNRSDLDPEEQMKQQ
jgi:hypothetical protein